MSKKTIVILIIIFLIIVLAGGGFFAYKNNLFPHFEKGGLGGIFSKSSDIALTPEQLLTFQIKNTKLSVETISSFQSRFEEVKSALQKNPDEFAAWLYLGVIKKGVGDYEGARDVFLYAAKIRPQSSTPFANLADLYAYFLNEPEKAEVAIKTAIANDPNDYSFYVALADIYRYKIPGKEVLYEKTLLDALKILPDDPNLISALAVYYRQIKQTDKAILYYEKLLKIFPDNQMAEEDLAALKNQK
jgi:tetratricopeptide (TPR) repeat protein